MKYNQTELIGQILTIKPADLHTQLANLFDHTYLLNNKQIIEAKFNALNNRLDYVHACTIQYFTEQKRQEMMHVIKTKLFLMSQLFALDEQQGRDRNRTAWVSCIQTHILQLDQLRGTLQQNRLVATHTATNAITLASRINLAIQQLILLLHTSFTELIQSVRTASTKLMIEILSSINMQRLQIVWTNVLMSSILDLFANNFFYKTNAMLLLKAVARVTGYLSWILYYARFAINFALVLKHTFAASVQEQTISMWTRFKQQLDQRKYQLINDLMWATLNLSTFYWLVGNGTMGYIGMIASGVALTLDLILNIIRYKEEQRIHTQALQTFDAEIAILRAKTTEDCTISINILEETKEQAIKQYQHKKYAIWNDIGFSVGIASGFTLVASCFVPAGMAPIALLNVVPIIGAAICFTSVIAYTIISERIALQQLIDSIQHNQATIDQLTLQYSQPTTSAAQKRDLFLEINSLEAKIAHTQQLVQFKRIKMFQSIIMNIVMPTLMFTALVFIPAGFASIGLLLATVLLNMLVSHYLEKNYKPKEFTPPVFTDDTHITKQMEIFEQTRINTPPAITNKEESPISSPDSSCFRLFRKDTNKENVSRKQSCSV